MSYTYFPIIAYCCLSVLLDLLEIGILDIVITIAALCLLSSGICTTVESGTCTWLSTASLLIHLGRGSLHDLIEVVDGIVDSCHVASLMSSQPDSSCRCVRVPSYRSLHFVQPQPSYG